MSESQQLSDQVSGIDKKVTSILHLLKGTDLDDEQGLLSEFRQEKAVNKLLHGRVEKLEKLRDKIIYIMVGMSIPAGYGIFEMIKSLAKVL